MTTGRAWTFSRDNINTDEIIRSVYTNETLEKQAEHCLETLDPTFAKKVSRGDFIVAGENFGAGSSRPAYATILALGIAGVIAESFSRVFFRNSISGGLLVMPCPGISKVVQTGHVISVDSTSGTICDLTTGAKITCQPLPLFLREMVECGGEKPYLKARMSQHLPG